MQQYTELLDLVLREGEANISRNGIRFGVRGAMFQHDLKQGFPAVTTKQLAFSRVASELCWFLNGGTNITDLHEWDNHIWDQNAKEDGDVGPLYGYQWRSFNGEIDQIYNALVMLQENPRSSRNVVTAWNPLQLEEMSLPPCHFAFQLHSDGLHLDLTAFMRSADICVGVPFNIASYGLLCHLFGQVVGLLPRKLTLLFSDIHIYEEHMPLAYEQVKRTSYDLPTLKIDPIIPPDLTGLQPSQFSLLGYKCHPPIKYRMIP